MRRLSLAAPLMLLAAPAPSAAVTIDWVAIGNPGNPPDSASNCYSADCGSVAYTYYISKYEVTNAQYAEFLNAKAASDPFGLYSIYMDSNSDWGGITRSGVSGSYTYAAKSGHENKPVAFISFYDALRFANWLNNGQGSGDTETGAYTITETGITNNSITRNPGAITFVPNENEWYKAAYYSPSGVYFDYPTGTNTPTECVPSTSDTGNSANCWPAYELSTFTDVGAYALSESPYGTFDQGGNVREWNETIEYDDGRGFRGGDSICGAAGLGADHNDWEDPLNDWEYFGFRVAAILESSITVEIDIRPWNRHNFIYPFSRLLVPVALIGSDDLDVADADVTTLAFGPPGGASGASPALPFFLSDWDLNNDDEKDLVSYYRADETGIVMGDTEACLTGKTLEGTSFEGCDAITTVSCGLGAELVFLLPPLMWLHGRRRHARA